jgi:hypothetical protein
LAVEGSYVAAPNIHSRDLRGYDDDAIRTIADDVAGYAAVVLDNAEKYHSATMRAEQLAEAMSSRAVIEQAEGIIMGRRGCSADAAFDMLVQLS